MKYRDRNFSAVRIGFFLKAIGICALTIISVACGDDREILTDLSGANEPDAGIGFFLDLQNSEEGETLNLQVKATKKLFEDHTFSVVDSLSRGGFTLTDQNGGNGPFKILAGTDITVLRFSFNDDDVFTPESPSDTVVLHLDNLVGDGAFLVRARMGSESRETSAYPSIRMVRIEND
ncbi:MAG: hypothetical protein RIG77_22045 [Cyclobacteriaceae bacterium]